MAKNKNVNVLVTFKNGTVKTGQVQVEAAPYASVQSQACTKRTSLIAKVSTGKMTVEDATTKWNSTIRQKWIDMVSKPFRAGLPTEVLNEITSIEPETSMLNLELPVVNK